MKRLLIVLAVMLSIGTGCITTGSKDIKMINTVAELLVEEEVITAEDRDIIISITNKYDQETNK